MEKTSTYGDAILMVDDILPYDDPVWAKQQKKTVNDVIRTYGDRTGLKMQFQRHMPKLITFRVIVQLGAAA